MNLADIRTTYQKDELLESSVASKPYQQFGKWLDQAMHSQVMEPTAMTLATATKDARPSARTVLLKGFDEQGFVFYTNYDSRKGNELNQNPYASILFFWPELERQVRIEGSIQQTPAQESDAYYNSRPLGSRIGAWASPQSQAISHEQLAKNVQTYTSQLGNNPQRPPYWGGYILSANYFEFWQGRPSRLHDRLIYTLNASNNWSINRIAP